MLVTLVAVVGCSTYHGVDLEAPGATPQSTLKDLEPGGLFRFTLRDHSQRETVIVAIESDAIVGLKDRRIPRSEIVTLAGVGFGLLSLLTVNGF